MKKAALLFLLAFSLVSVTFAQNGNGNGGGRREMMKQRLKDSLQLSDVKADSVADIQQQYQPQMREVMMDQGLDQETKTTKIDAIIQERRTKLKSVLTDDQVAKLEAMEQRMRAQMRQRMENGGGNK